MNKVYVVLIRGGMSSENELHILFMTNYKAEYWRVHGFYTSKKQANQVKKELESPLHVITVKSWRTNMLAVA